MARLFNSISIPLKRRNKFNLSYESRLTTEFGRLTPFMCEPVIPNDRFQISTNFKIDFAPMKFPVMQKFTAYAHYFFVPNRLLWDQWETFITGGEDGLQEPDYPVIHWDDTLGDYLDDEGYDALFSKSSLFDYLGFPTIGPSDDLADAHSGGNDIDALPFKAYQLIYNEWYRDQNLTSPVVLDTDVSGPQMNSHVPDFCTLRQRAWKKDYFTSALPDPQRGPDVTLPILGDIEISGTGEFGLTIDTIKSTTGESSMELHASGGSELFVSPSDETDFTNQQAINLLGTAERNNVASGLSGKIVDSQGDPTLRSATINEVRRAFAIQRWYELAARAGSRYVEQILAHFGIRSSDARLQRPEYLGGAVIPVFIGDVLQTSATTATSTPLGTPAGVGQAGGSVRPVCRTFEEHGWIIGILSVLPEAAYPQGMPRKFLKRDKFDFAWPLLANLGEQEIQKQELYFDFTQSSSYNKEGFGYTPRYAEYKHGSGEVHGDFRYSLADFHDARFFDQRPALNDDFITVKTDVANPNSGLNRIFSVRSGQYDHLWVYLYNDIRVRRVLPKYGTPI